MTDRKWMPYLAKDEELSFLGLKPGEEVKGKILGQSVDQMLRCKRSLQLAMDSCVHCGACMDQCHSYLGTGDLKNTPVGRGDLFRKAYSRIHPGRWPWSRNEGTLLNEETVSDWYTYFYQCNECRRCAEVCPAGIDTAEITIAARELLGYSGLVPRFIGGVAKNMLQVGNNMGINGLALRDMTEFLEDELEEETGRRIPIPVEEPGAEVLYVPSSSDLFTNTDNLMGAAKLFYAAGLRWTLAEDVVETANFGLFFNEGIMREHHQRLMNAARRLGVKRIVVGECGHGWRTWRMFKAAMEGTSNLPLTHVIEETCRLLTDGAVQVDKSANERPVTYHDPCNLARGGGIIEEPREILRRVVTDFREMTPNRELSFCCGGGSGLLMDEMMETRMKLGIKKAESIKGTGAEIVCAPCAICKAQLPPVMKHYDISVEVKGLLDLVGYAIIL